MGLLDDAIREHLELKRRRGANPDEVSREEHEALGPATRQGEFARPADADDADDALDADPPEPEDDTAEHDAGAYAAPPAEELPEGEPGVAEEPARGAEAAAPGYDEDPWLREDEDSPAVEERAAEGEDVLEETPEFLQETPEHDRLWFEQKPPRDFDWDR